jgi:hypothetical protein
MDVKQTLAQMLEIDKLSEEKQLEIMDKVSSVIFEAVMTRIVADMTEAEQDKFEGFLQGNPSPTDLMDKLKEERSDFDQILEEETAKFKEYAESAMGGLS